MRDLLGVLASVALALGLIAAALFALGDREVLTSPPDAVAEGFMKELASDRYVRALPYLDKSLERTATEADLRRAHKRYVEKVGKVLDVRGEEGRISQDEASAIAEMETERKDQDRLEFHLRFSEGVWKIDRLPAELQ